MRLIQYEEQYFRFADHIMQQFLAYGINSLIRIRATVTEREREIYGLINKRVFLDNKLAHIVGDKNEYEWHIDEAVYKVIKELLAS